MRRKRLISRKPFKFDRDHDVRAGPRGRRRSRCGRAASGRGIVADRSADDRPGDRRTRRQAQSRRQRVRRAPTPPVPASNPLPSLPASAAAPITVLSNELGNTMLPGQDSSSGTNTTGQSSSVANADAPGECLLALGRSGGGRQQQLLDDVRREQPAGRTGRRQRAGHGAGQRRRPHEPGRIRARLGERAVCCVDVAERRHQRRRPGEHLLGQRRSGRQHLE